MSERERRIGTVPAATASTERKEVVVSRKTNGGRQSKMTFKFDEVLSSFSTQEDVFASTLQPLVGQVLAGYEATAFAYGQTGTGKTYTMEGNTNAEEARGLMPRAAAAVLDALAKGKYGDHHVAVSYLEIYNEELTDLLAPVGNQPKLELLEAGGGRGVCCVGLSEVAVSQMDDISRLVSLAQERRRVAETRINARSSRSHCIFTMKVQSRRSCEGGEQETVGKLHLVDLAGSECAKKAAMVAEEPATCPTATQKPLQNQSQAAASLLEQERERKNINQSLLTLRRVIAALREKSARVPYRDSKLTRLLQSALGGSCRTVVIATISPALAVVEETISTLTYAEQAAGIQNRPVAISSLRTPGAGGTAPEGFGDLTPAGAGELSADVEMRMTYMLQEVEEAQAALTRKHQEVMELTERAEHAEEEVERLREENQELQDQVGERDITIRKLMGSACSLAERLESTAAKSVAGVRERITSKTSLLGKQEATAAEERVGALLSAQKQTVQTEAADVRSALDGMRAELAAARAENAELRKSQARSRAAALESVLAFATRELESVGQQLDVGAQGIDSRFDKAEALVDTAGDSVVSAEARSAAAGVDVGRATEQWARDIAARCEELDKDSQETTSAVEQGIGAVVEELRALGTSSDSSAAAGNAAAGAGDRLRQGGGAAEGDRPAGEWDSHSAKENVSLAADGTAVIAKAAEKADAVAVSAPLAAAATSGTAKATRSLKAPSDKAATTRGPLREVN